MQKHNTCERVQRKKRGQMKPQRIAKTEKGTNLTKLFKTKRYRVRSQPEKTNKDGKGL